MGDAVSCAGQSVVPSKGCAELHQLYIIAGSCDFCSREQKLPVNDLSVAANAASNKRIH
jgi:hypothetical protein